jgi:hypothetical protein
MYRFSDYTKLQESVQKNLIFGGFTAVAIKRRKRRERSG